LGRWRLESGRKFVFGSSTKNLRNKATAFPQKKNHSTGGQNGGHFPKYHQKGLIFNNLLPIFNQNQK
jgi:hypothetical protein